ncbi:Hypothetical_protein [Hexamita inflata]|uniref:Hypothetical_protein n=1 Tax=Hexamita inflata TaxID=28002 RepID=A0AA86UGS6_9EUKA|nr:Hypothetical protein HINF_LOCUS45165 [Hexamita inflata]
MQIENDQIRTVTMIKPKNPTNLKTFLIQILNLVILDVNLWSGQWQTIQLVDCTFTGELEEGQLQIDLLTLQINNNVDLTPIYNIKANEIDVDAYSEEQNDKISLQFKHANIYAKIQNFTFDLHEVTDQFKQLFFIFIDFVHIYECSLNQVDQMNGKWQRLKIFMCNLKTDNNFTINASHIDIFNSDNNLTNFQGFSADSMDLGVPLVQIFPQAKMLSINEAQLECLQSNTNIKKLVLNKCTFTKFSISLFPSLVAIQLQGDQYNQLNFQLNQLLKEKNRALKKHKKNARQMEQQLVQHQKKMRRKQHNKYLDLITKYINNIAISKE